MLHTSVPGTGGAEIHSPAAFFTCRSCKWIGTAVTTDGSIGHSGERAGVWSYLQRCDARVLINKRQQTCATRRGVGRCETVAAV